MTTSGVSQSDRQSKYDARAIYTAIKSYDINHLIREAVDNGVLSSDERKTIGNSRRDAREQLLSLMLVGEERLQQFREFFGYYAGHVYEVSVRALLPPLSTPLSTMNPQSLSGVADREYQPLSQDSFSSDCTSPMELDPTEDSDMGYYTYSQTGTVNSNTQQSSDLVPNQQGIATDTDGLRRNLETVQSSQKSLQKYIALKKQEGLSQQEAQLLPYSSTTQTSAQNIHVTNVYISMVPNSGFERKGAGDQVQFPSDSNRGRSDDFTLKPWGDEWRCVDQHYGTIIENMNVNALLPNLIEKGLLTQGEIEDIEKYGGRQQNRTLLRILRRKGENSFQLFLECLKKEKDHLGHKDIANLLGFSSQA